MKEHSSIATFFKNEILYPFLIGTALAVLQTLLALYDLATGALSSLLLTLKLEFILNAFIYVNVALIVLTSPVNVWWGLIFYFISTILFFGVVAIILKQLYRIFAILFYKVVLFLNRAQ